jgi:hypothetical protein
LIAVNWDRLHNHARRQNLVIVSRGPDAPKMIREPDANWDWIELRWHPKTELLPADKSIFEPDRAVRKFTGVAKHFQPDIKHYERIALLDDDIEVADHSWSQIFNLFKKTGAGIGHPAITLDSCLFEMTQPCLLQHPHVEWRETNWCELCSTLFTRESLQKCMWALEENVAGWGNEDVFREQEKFLAILDATPVRSRRPPGTSVATTGLNFNPHEAVAEFRRKHGLAPVVPKTFAVHKPYL